MQNFYIPYSRLMVLLQNRYSRMGSYLRCYVEGG